MPCEKLNDTERVHATRTNNNFFRIFILFTAQSIEQAFQCRILNGGHSTQPCLRDCFQDEDKQMMK